jgi:hypothetical protein
MALFRVDYILRPGITSLIMILGYSPEPKVDLS